jgi:hypothetical protein
MSGSGDYQYNRLLKRCLQVEGVRWKTRSYILRNPHRDHQVIAALRNRGVRLQTQEVQREFISMMHTAANLARRGEARLADTSYDFVLTVR